MDHPTRSAPDGEPGSPFPSEDPVLDRIGDTSLVRYPEPGYENVRCKLETENPTGSMKDRIALGILSTEFDPAEHEMIVEASSGNTAGSIALVANRLGVDCHVTCPASTSDHKIGYMEAFGATVHECPDVDSDHPEHYHQAACDLADGRDAYFVDQYRNLANPRTHYQWTGPELWAQAGSSMTHFVCPMGTGGTCSGTARYLAERAAQRERDLTVIGVDAEQSNVSTAFYGEDPVPYDTAVEGLGKDERIPTMWFDPIDEVRSVADAAAFEQARTAAREHGLLIGPSSGAALSVAREVSDARPDATVVTMVCDGGEQYFDTLFGD